MGIKKVLNRFKSTKQLPHQVTPLVQNQQVQDDKKYLEVPLSVGNLEGINQLNQMSDLDEHKGVGNKMLVSMQASRECGYVEWGPLTLDFFVTVMIPVGYELESEEAYALNIAIDKHLIQLLSLEKQKPAQIQVEDENGTPVLLEGISPVYQMKLSGSLVYNVMLEGFKAAQPLTVMNEPQFTVWNTVFIDRVLGYVCYACHEEENPLAQYALTLIEDEEVLVILPNKQVSVQEGSQEFFELIGDQTVQRGIGKQYTIIVTGSPEPIS